MFFNFKKIVSLAFFVLIVIWCVGILWEVTIYFFPKTLIALPFLKHNYSIVCHTETEKLLEIGTFTTLTCSRCTGIYFGALIISLLSIFGISRYISLKFFLLSSTPMILDVFIYSIGIYNYSKYLALFTGLLLGSIGFLYIHNSIIEFLNNKRGIN